ncbi:hypothetical protein [Epilithonimonas arachidiradicis]|nr:hypothetical protein [Epilithonimonas arachidiradicis]RKE89566.1 hypothetical protein BXY58_0135 [Epilithonimonas arachidiradicis]
MKSFIFSFFLLSIWGSSQIIDEDFKKIPDSLYFRDNLYKYIRPNHNYSYWKVVRKDDSLTTELIYESTKSKNWNYLESFSPNNGFFEECHPDGCFTYIIAYQNKEVKYFTDGKELRNFIGFINNLPEALLIARTYNLWFDDKNSLGGSYKIEKDFIYLYLAKFESCPISREAFFVKINRKTGELEKESKGIYYKKNDCYTS